MEKSNEYPDILNNSLEECLRFEGNGFRKKRSSILKQSTKYMNIDVCENDDTEFTRKSQNLKRVSFADTFEVMELHTGNIYHIPGHNESSKDCCSSQICSSDVDRENFGEKSCKVTTDGITGEPLTDLAMCQQSENIKIKVTETEFVHEESSSTYTNSSEQSFCFVPQYGKREYEPEVSETVKSLLENSSEENDMNISALTPALVGSMCVEKENYIYQTHHVSSEHTICSVSRSSNNVFPDKSCPQGFVKVDIVEKSFENVLIQDKNNVPTKSSLYVINSNKVENERIAVKEPPFSSLSTVNKHNLMRSDGLNNQSNKENIYGLPKASSAAFTNSLALQKATVQTNDHKLQTLKQNIFDPSFLKCNLEDTHKELLAHDRSEIFNDEKLKKMLDGSINISKQDAPFINQLTSCKQNTRTETTHIQETSNLDETNMSLPDMDVTCVGTLNKSNYPEPALFPQHMQDFITANCLPIQKTHAINKKFIGVENINQRSLPHVSDEAGGIKKTSRKSLNKTKLTLEDMDITCMPDYIMEDRSLGVNTDQVDFVDVTEPVESDDLYGKHQLSITHLENRKDGASRNFDLICDSKITPMDMTCVGTLEKPNYPKPALFPQHMQDFTTANFPPIQQTGATSEKLIKVETVSQRSLPHVSDDAGGIKKTSRKSLNKTKLTLEDMDMTCMPDNIVEDCSPKVNTCQGDFMDVTKTVKSDDLYSQHQLSIAHFEKKNSNTHKDFKLINTEHKFSVKDGSKWENSSSLCDLSPLKPTVTSTLFPLHTTSSVKISQSDNLCIHVDEMKSAISKNETLVNNSFMGKTLLDNAHIDKLGESNHEIKLFHDSEQKTLTCEPTTANIPFRCESPVHKQNPQNQKDGSLGKKFMKIAPEFESPHKHLKSLSPEEESECSFSSIRCIDEKNLNGSRKRNANDEIPCFPSKNIILEANYNPEDPAQRDLPRKRQSRLLQSSFMDMTCIADESLVNSEDSSVFLTQATAIETSSISILKITVPEPSQSNILDTDKTVSNTSPAKSEIFTSNFMDLTSISDSSEKGNLIKAIETDLKTCHFQSFNMDITCAGTTDNKHLANDSQLDNTSNNSITNHSAENLASECLTKLSNHDCGAPAMSLSAIERDNFYLSNKTHLEGKNTQCFTSDPMDFTCKSEYLKEIQLTTGDHSHSSLSEQVSLLNCNDKLSFASSLSKEKVPCIEEVDSNAVSKLPALEIPLQCLISINQSEKASADVTENPSFSELQDLSPKRSEQNASIEKGLVHACQDNKCCNNTSVKRNIKTCEEEEKETFLIKRSKIVTPGVVYRMRKVKQYVSQGLHENIFFSPEINKLLKRKQSFGYKQPFSEIKVCTPVNYHCKKSRSFSSFVRESSFTEQPKQDQNISYKLLESHKVIQDNPTALSEPFKEFNLKKDSPPKSADDAEESFITESVFFSEKNDSSHLKLDKGSHFHYENTDKKSIEGNPSVLSEPYKELNPKESSPPKNVSDITKNVFAEAICNNVSKFDNSQVSHLHNESTIDEDNSFQLLPNSILNSTTFCDINTDKDVSLLVNRTLLPNHVSRTVAKESDVNTNLDRDMQIETDKCSFHPVLSSEEAVHILEPLNITNNEGDQPQEKKNVVSSSTKQLVQKTETKKPDIMIVSVQSDSIEIQRKPLGNVSLFERTVQMSCLTPSNPSLGIEISKPSEISSKDVAMFYQNKDEKKKVHGSTLMKPNLTSLTSVINDAEILPNLNKDAKVEAGNYSCHLALFSEESMHALEPLNTTSNDTHNERDQPHEKKNLLSSSAKQAVQMTEFDTKTVSLQSNSIENLQRKEKAVRNVSLLEHSVEPLNTKDNMTVVERSQLCRKKDLLHSSTKQPVRATNFDTEVDSVISDAVEILQRKQKGVGNVNLFQESVTPPNPSLNIQNPKPLEVASNNVDMFMHQDLVNVPDNVHLTADTDEEIDIRLSSMKVGSISGGNASETSSPSAPTSLHLLKDQIEQASGKEARWILKILDENQAVFQLQWGPWLYKCRMMVYVDQMNPNESRVSFATTSKGADELENIGYNCFMYLVSDEVVPFPVCSERIILKITEYSNIAKKVEALMRDILRITLSNEYTISESLNPLKISAEVFNENLESKFELIFDVNLHSYPNEKIIPVVKHLMFNDIRKTVQNALASVQPGECYLWNMANTADKL